MKSPIKLVFILCLLMSTSAFAYKWVESAEGYDCKITCSEAGLKTHYTDKVNDTNKKFYVCMANINEEGFRAGYSKSHNPGCKIAYNNEVETSMNFYCMCG